MTEKKVQSDLIKFLKKKGCYVIKTKPGAGTPVGCPDIIALYEGLWLAFEVKRSATAPFRPLQKETIDKLSEWSFAWVVCPENYDQVIDHLHIVL